jgi:uncharacterized damage-inducible protein DinB
MTNHSQLLSAVYDGWDGYNTSLVHAVEPLTPEQLAWRPAEGLNSVGETAAHLAFARVFWFARMPAPGSLELERKIKEVGSSKAIAGDRAEILAWLEATWHMIAATLNRWTVDDLRRTYRHPYQGKDYAVSYQWTIWRILTHDLHHGGELSVMLGQQGIEIPELGDLFGHLTEPPLAEDQP